MYKTRVVEPGAIAFVTECESGCGKVLFDERICGECLNEHRAFVDKQQALRFRKPTIWDVLGTAAIVGVGLSFFVGIGWGIGLILKWVLNQF